MQRALDFDKTPALMVPLPFLLNVPIFMLLSAVLAISTGNELFASRWSRSSLAITHLWTLGILGSAMLGALMQILAVACNVPLARAKLISSITYISLTLGTLALVGGFIWWSETAWLLASILLSLSFLIYLLAIASALWQARKQVYKGAKEILIPIRLALISLAITVILGISQALALAYGNALPNLIASHVLWGLAGWGGLLLMAMSFQLLPIFQLTELFPKSVCRWLPILIPGLLLAWTALEASQGLPRLMLETAEFLLLLAYMIWVCAGLHRMFTRKRPKPEPSALFWFTCLFSLLACAPAWLWLNYGNSSSASTVFGILIIIGGLGSAVNGMIYKIVPFLLWKHAQNAMVIPDKDPAQARVYLRIMPKMAAYIPVKPAQAQWFIQLLVILACLSAALGWSAAQIAAGPLMLISALLLGFNIAKAVWLYRKTLKIMAELPHHQPR